MEPLRKCVRCGLEATNEEDLVNFKNSKNSKYGKQNCCRDCHNLYAKEHSERNPESKRNAVYKNEYGITIEDYNKMFEKQNGKCAICKKHQSEFKKRLAIDHCHKEGHVRGLLCQPCNAGLGCFKDSVDNMLSAIMYLKIHDE